MQITNYHNQAIVIYEYFNFNQISDDKLHFLVVLQRLSEKRKNLRLF